MAGLARGMRDMQKNPVQVHQVHFLITFMNLGYELVVFYKFIKFIKFILVSTSYNSANKSQIVKEPIPLPPERLDRSTREIDLLLPVTSLLGRIATVFSKNFRSCVFRDLAEQDRS